MGLREMAEEAGYDYENCSISRWAVGEIESLRTRLAAAEQDRDKWYEQGNGFKEAWRTCRDAAEAAEKERDELRAAQQSAKEQYWKGYADGVVDQKQSAKEQFALGMEAGIDIALAEKCGSGYSAEAYNSACDDIIAAIREAAKEGK